MWLPAGRLPGVQENLVLASGDVVPSDWARRSAGCPQGSQLGLQPGAILGHSSQAVVYVLGRWGHSISSAVHLMLAAVLLLSTPYLPVRRQCVQRGHWSLMLLARSVCTVAPTASITCVQPCIENLDLV
jgi:hypothetical protein